MKPPVGIAPVGAYNKLRDYQKQAVDSCIVYIDQFDASSPASMLVAMPTGSGKTAVMGVLSRCNTLYNDIILIVSPRKAISEQLQKEIGEVFFKEKLKISGELARPSEYYRSTMLPGPGTSKVLITTIQQLDFLKRSTEKKYTHEYAELVKRATLVVFDEGHYEPALSWSTTIRAFSCPRIIFTATPFRNDFKGFDIDWKKAFSASYYQVRKGNFLREVHFNEEVKPASAKQFLDKTLGYYKTNFGTLDGRSAKVIINCNNYDSIVTLADLLTGLGYSFIAVHERFSDRYKAVDNGRLSQQRLKSVPPDPEKMGEAIWLHQYKLLEGIDDHSFKMLSIYEPFASTRALIQQVGRIIRNPLKSGDPGYVYDFSGGRYKSEWGKYLQYDQQNDITRDLGQAIFEKFTSSLDDLTYEFKKLRSKFVGKDFESWGENAVLENLRLPLKVNLLQRGKAFDHKHVADGLIEGAFLAEDKIYYRKEVDSKTTLFYYFTVSNSEFLAENYFPTISQDILLIRDEDDYIAFYDSSGRNLAGEEKYGIGMPISPDKLHKIFNDSPQTRFFRVGLKNSNLGAGDLRSHSFSSPSLARTTPFLNDFTHFMGSAFGSYPGTRPFKTNADPNAAAVGIGTYVGFSKGRLSQDSGNYVSLREYFGWLEQTKKLLNQSSRQPSSFFSRYASQLTSPTSNDRIPVNILIDLSELNEELATLDNEETGSVSESIADACLLVEETQVQGKTIYSFELVVNGQGCEIGIEYNEHLAKYALKGDCQVPEIISKETLEPVDLVSFFNKRQCFRILTKTRCVYSSGHFYKANLKTGKSFDEKKFPLNGIIHGIPELSKISSEKGTTSKPGGVGWADASLFGFIDRHGRDSSGAGTIFTTLLGSPDLLLCTDLNTEVADFVAVSGNKMIFLHVKGNGNNNQGKQSHYSATGISEVCSQAIKNVHYLSAFDSARPKNINTFISPHIVTNAKLKIDINVKSRLRTVAPKLNMTQEELWEIVEKVKFDGAAEREVWLVMGRIFSKSRFLAQLHKKDPAPEAVQAAILLQNTMASIGQMGVRLRIFCSP